MNPQGPQNTSGQTDSTLLDAAITTALDASQTQPDAERPQPTPEDLCDGQDTDGDGQIDEGFEIGQPCDTGRPGCSLDGLFVCTQDGGRRCALPEQPAQIEQCNALDDDCDGAIDEGINGVGTPCTNGVGACEVEGFLRCNPEGQVSCDATPNRRGVERCNFIDDDCDGVVDEDLRLTTPCTVGNGICVARGEFVCGDDGDVVCSAIAPAGTDESCDSIDNDCDGLVDEDRACGPYIESHCRIYLGWADRREGPIRDGDFGVSDTFGNCPRDDDDGAFRERCESTRRDGLMRRLTLPDYHTFNGDDLFSVAFRCDDEESPALSRWIERRCQVSIGYVTENPPVVPQETWGTCPIDDGVDGAYRCVRSGGDRRFHTMVASDRDCNSASLWP